MTISVEELKARLIELKSIDLDQTHLEHGKMMTLIDFINLDSRTKYDKTMWLVKDVYNLLSNPEPEELDLVLLVFNKISDLMVTDQILGATMIGLARTEAKPNYQMLPKITLEKIKYQKLLDLLFTYSNETLNAVKCCEFIRQREWDFKTFIILLIRSRVILWLKLNEPKSVKWYIGFFNKEIDSDTKLETEIDNIVSIFS